MVQHRTYLIRPPLAYEYTHISVEPATRLLRMGIGTREDISINAVYCTSHKLNYEDTYLNTNHSIALISSNTHYFEWVLVVKGRYLP